MTNEEYKELIKSTFYKKPTKIQKKKARAVHKVYKEILQKSPEEFIVETVKEKISKARKRVENKNSKENNFLERAVGIQREKSLSNRLLQVQNSFDLNFMSGDIKGKQTEVEKLMFNEVKQNLKKAIYKAHLLVNGEINVKEEFVEIDSSEEGGIIKRADSEEGKELELLGHEVWSEDIVGTHLTIVSTKKENGKLEEFVHFYEESVDPMIYNLVEVHKYPDLLDFNRVLIDNRDKLWNYPNSPCLYTIYTLGEFGKVFHINEVTEELIEEVVQAFEIEDNSPYRDLMNLLGKGDLLWRRSEIIVNQLCTILEAQQND